MFRHLLNRKVLFTLLLISGLVAVYMVNSEPPVDFNADVKPILNRKCISCHGGVKKKGGFSLLFEEEALAATESGKPAIIPGDPHASDMIRRLTATDPEERMPYKEAPLTDVEIDILSRWVKQGAKWGKHWAYQSVEKQDVPSLPRRLGGLLPGVFSSWKKNDIDHFIAERLRDKELQPSAEADKNSLLRRVSLDLIGMPAPPDITRRFLEDSSPEAYEKLVDNLLSLPAYGERWTAMWMDLSRYADTKGYERDDRRQIWRYRDWLIQAFNSDKPYDQFITEQLAGDLLPSPTDAQYLATAFHRNTMTNDEGGTDNEEFRTAAVIDRVNTTWEVLMGTTFACVQCHSHPYDPFRYEDYYKFMGYFNNTRDEDTFDDYPLLYEYKSEDSIRFKQVSNWLQTTVDPKEANRVINFLRTRQPAVNSLVADQIVNGALADTKWLALRNYSSARIKNFPFQQHTKLLIRYVTPVPDGILELRIDSLNGPVIGSLRPNGAAKGWFVEEFNLKSVSDNHDLFLRFQSASLEKDRNGIQFDWFHMHSGFPGKGKSDYDTIRRAFDHLVTKARAVTTPVMVENPAELYRSTHMFDRGNWMVKGQEVRPGIPASLNPFPSSAPNNRLGLAMWITDKKNPLTSRTIVNRIWEQLFGQGLVETLEDLGSQGIQPTHPALLDHLSWKLMHEWNWSLKMLLKEMVLSATYRQDSRVTPELLEKDRFNKWYARGPRFRLSAEQIRDQALAVSGILNTGMYGPGKMPWQPNGIWNSPYNGDQWVASHGKEKYRRSIYTYWKRTAAYPSMITFDAMQREVCVSRRIRTNTPLQALTVMNDPVYVDISRQFALNLLKENSRPQWIIEQAYLRATGRKITDTELASLLELYKKSLERYQKDAHATCEMATGIEKDSHNRPETAALVVTIHAIMNLDQVLTKS